MLDSQQPPFVPEGAEAMTVRLDLPPGDPGSPPHRHSGPVFGYMLEGEMIFELEGGTGAAAGPAGAASGGWELVVRVFLAGATGVIGRRLVPLLVGQGHSVTGLVRRSADADWLRSLGAKAVRGDVYDADGMRRAVALAAPDVVMHQLTDLKGGNRRANSEMRTTGTRHLVDAALAAGVRRVVAQSIAWMYEAGSVPATEDVPLDLGADESRLRSVLGVASLEAAVREAPEWVVLRYGLLYGPGTWYSRGGLMADTAARGGLAADGDVSSFVHVDDAAGAAVEALSWPTGFVNVCDDVPAPGREWVPAFCRAVGVAPVPVASGGERHGWARGASNEYARKELNWTPAWPSWRDGFAAL